MIVVVVVFLVGFVIIVLSSRRSLTEVSSCVFMVELILDNAFTIHKTDFFYYQLLTSIVTDTLNEQ